MVQKRGRVGGTGRKEEIRKVSEGGSERGREGGREREHTDGQMYRSNRQTDKLTHKQTDRQREIGRAHV